MKILYFHQHFSTPNGSVGTRSYEMARRLVAQGHHVVVVCGSYGGGESGLTVSFSNGYRRGFVEDVEVIEFDLAYANSYGMLRRVFVFFKFAFRSVKVAFTEEYDLLFATSTPLTVAIPGIFSRWLRRKPFVFEVRDLWPELPRAMGVIRNPLLLATMSLLEWLSYHSANRLIGLSPGIVDGIVRRGIPRERIALIPNGCDLDIFDGIQKPWRPKEIRQDDMLVLFAGTHGVANGLSAVLEVATELKRRGRDDIKLLLVGQGKLKPQLQARAISEGLDNLIFHDPINKRRLAGLMASADIGLQVLANVPAFYFGTSPNKFFDYISAGCPVLNNYPGWLADLILINQCGFFVPPESPGLFADTLENASNNRPLLKEMGRNARALAEKEFNREKLAANFVEWLEGIRL